MQCQRSTTILPFLSARNPAGFDKSFLSGKFHSDENPRYASPRGAVFFLFIRTEARSQLHLPPVHRATSVWGSSLPNCIAGATIGKGVGINREDELSAISAMSDQAQASKLGPCISQLTSPHYAPHTPRMVGGQRISEFFARHFLKARGMNPRVEMKCSSCKPDTLVERDRELRYAEHLSKYEQSSNAPQPARKEALQRLVIGRGILSSTPIDELGTPPKNLG